MITKIARVNNISVGTELQMVVVNVLRDDTILALNALTVTEARTLIDVLRNAVQHIRTKNTAA